MPWYDVGYLEYSAFGAYRGELPRKRGWLKTPARSASEALEAGRRDKYLINSDSTRVLTGKIVELKDEWDTKDRDYWRGKWRDAMKAMPYKIISNWTMEWLPQPKGETALPTFIKGHAKGKMKIIGGQVHCLTKTVHSTSEQGRASNLAILLGYITWEGKDHKRKRANSCAMLGRKIPESSRPRASAARYMLAHLGSMTKQEIKALLAQKRSAVNAG